MRKFLFPLLLLLSACSMSVHNSDNVDFDLASEAVIHIDNWVRLSPLQVHVYPTGDPVRSPRALFIPFRVTQRMEDASLVGQNISRIIWQSWLEGEVFDTLEFSNTQTPFRPDVALALARQRGADTVVGGYVQHFLDGGTVSQTVVSIEVQAYNVQTGDMIWSMSQGGLMPASSISDYLLFATKSRMPTDPAAAIITAIGRDMARKLRTWAKGDASTIPDDRPRGEEKKAF